MLQNPEIKKKKKNQPMQALLRNTECTKQDSFPERSSYIFRRDVGASKTRLPKALPVPAIIAFSWCEFSQRPIPRAPNLLPHNANGWQLSCIFILGKFI